MVAYDESNDKGCIVALKEAVTRNNGDDYDDFWVIVDTCFWHNIKFTNWSSTSLRF